MEPSLLHRYPLILRREARVPVALAEGLPDCGTFVQKAVLRKYRFSLALISGMCLIRREIKKDSWRFINSSKRVSLEVLITDFAYRIVEEGRRPAMSDF